MARLKIDIPQNLLTSVSIPVRITDINYGNHLGNSAVVEIIHEARVQFLNQHGFGELNVIGTSLIMSELMVDFKNESYYNDLLEIKIYSGEISKVSFELFYQITTSRNDQKIIIALAKTGMVCYDYDLKKVRPVPDKLVLILTHKS